MTVSRETIGWRSWPEAAILEAGARELGLTISPGQIQMLLQYLAELRHWNARLNLIGPSAPPEQIVLHLLDGLTGLTLLDDRPKRVMDLGSGAGIPGLVLGLVRPDWTVTLVEARSKKADFLRHVLRALGLGAATVRQIHLQPGGCRDSDPCFDLITFRAVGSLADILPLVRSYLVPGGSVLAYKGPRAIRELEEVGSACPGLALELAATRNLQLPFLGHERTLLLFRTI